MTELFINRIPNPRFRLLYIMGATWHTRCMFDLITHEDNFRQMLNQRGIETYAMDILGSGPGPKPDVIGDLYQATLDRLKEIISTHKILHVMGYSIGCSFAMQLAQTHSFEKIVLLDPRASVKVDRIHVNSDKFIITKTAVRQALTENCTHIDDRTAQDHVDSLCAGDQFETAAYPMTGRYSQVFDNRDIVTQFLHSNCVRAFFTGQSSTATRDMFAEHGRYWPDTSHWILLEPARLQLAQAVSDFLSEF